MTKTEFLDKYFLKNYSRDFTKALRDLDKVIENEHKPFKQVDKINRDLTDEEHKAFLIAWHEELNKH